MQPTLTSVTPANSSELTTNTKITQTSKRKLDHLSDSDPINISEQTDTPHEPKNIDSKSENSTELSTKTRNVESIYFGKFKIETWYYSPFPEEFAAKTLFVCQFCLKYMMFAKTLVDHKKKCTSKRPPGKIVYETDRIRIFEIHGKEEKLYCQNLCLLSKLFLDHKTIFYDVDPFLFYVLTERQLEYDNLVGYFSKEKRSYENYNLACITVLPPFQKRGYGYELTKLEQKIGSPERPLSDLGFVGYLSYWKVVILDLLQSNHGKNTTLREISKLTGIRLDDVVLTLKILGMLKFWRADDVICITPDMIESHIRNHQIDLKRLIDPDKIVWRKGL
ncbi:hypothetical protein HK098_004790 [Nowakowskiella sp. JEL0407]|nr:hypothetical protein HK098_004790 [Nowakowskiella sp. JEL0407]